MKRSTCYIVSGVAAAIVAIGGGIGLYFAFRDTDEDKENTNGECDKNGGELPDHCKDGTDGDNGGNNGGGTDGNNGGNNGSDNGPKPEPATEEQKKRWTPEFYDVADKDEDKSISLEEFEAYVTEFGKEQVEALELWAVAEESNIETWFQFHDIDNNEKLELSEWHTAMA